MKQVSNRRAKQNREYNKIRLVYLKENPFCGRCEFAKSTQIHHKKGRIESLLTNTEFFFPVCQDCHNWIELNPVEAKELRYSLNRL